MTFLQNIIFLIVHKTIKLWCLRNSLRYLIYQNETDTLWKFSYNLGFLLSHTILSLFASLLTKLPYVESKKTNEFANEELKSQTGLPYRVNYMIDLDTYYVPIFIHCSICDLIYTVLLCAIDVLYLIVIEYSCGLFVALR